MPVIFSYDIEDAQNIDHNRLQSMFERFGWERIGGSCYRYPVLPRVSKSPSTQQPIREDWLNCVVPALMCFRSFLKKRKLRLTKHSLNSHVSTGSHGAQILDGAKLKFGAAAAAFGEKNLRDWVDACVDAIPYE